MRLRSNEAELHPLVLGHLPCDALLCLQDKFREGAIGHCSFLLVMRPGPCVFSTYLTFDYILHQTSRYILAMFVAPFLLPNSTKLEQIGSMVTR
jgi:hypothetical protein